MNPEKKKAQIAVVGCGNWGRNLVRNFHDLSALRLICDVNEDLLQTLRTEFKVPSVLSFSDVLSYPGIEAVVIATRAEQHAAMVREALLAGKDVFVEKPMALYAEEGKELVNLAREKNLILMVGHILQYHGAVRKLKELTSCGELGRVRYIYSNRLNLGKFRREENILWSFAPHDLSVILSLAQENPERMACQGGAYLHARIADVTVSTLTFSSGLRAHVFVSWLHPYKEQKLIVVGEKKMAVFNDVEPEEKLRIFPHLIEWKEGMPIPIQGTAETIAYDRTEPLQEECRHFIECIQNRTRPLTDGEEGLKVLRVLQSLQESLEKNGAPVHFAPDVSPIYFVHPTATVDPPSDIRKGVKIWHYAHISANATIGENSNLGQNVYVGPNVKIGKNVKIQNNVSIYEGVELADDVFCGPSMVFTNVFNPRSHISRKHALRKTLVGKGATLGANSTIVCGHSVGEYSFIGAGALVNRDVSPYALVVGNPARRIGWVCRCGEKLSRTSGEVPCEACGDRYRIDEMSCHPVGK
jgi:UDP-2-acetamido-3-amino-2,3-dideoxy-glucuronate N-acetyltransferase